MATGAMRLPPFTNFAKRNSVRLLLLIMPLAAVAQPIPPGAYPAESGSPYDKAQQAFAAGQYREAAQLFAAVAAAEEGKQRAARPDAMPMHADAMPMHADALLMQAKSVVNLGNFAEADALLHRYLQHDAHSSQALYLLGFVLQRENKPADSLVAFTEAAAIKPPLPNDLKLVALDYVLLGDYVDAIHWLQRAVADDPTNAEAWYDLGRAQMHQANFAEAEHAFDHTIAVAPLDVKALDNLGLVYEAENRPDDALAAYSRAIQAQGTGDKGRRVQTNSSAENVRLSEQPLLDYATLLNSRNRFAEAIEPLRRALVMAPACSRCHEELAHAYSGIHQEELARKSMDVAVTLDPENPRLHFQLGQLYRREGDVVKANAEFKRSSDLYGTRSAETGR